MMSSVQIFSQLLVAPGVVVGAGGSYLTTSATERARWNRVLDSRWDDRRVEAYASYAQSVKRTIIVAQRIAAGRGLSTDSEPLPPTQVSLDLLEAAEAERASQWKTVLLLGHPTTVAAARDWHEHAWLQAYASALLRGSASVWEEARTDLWIAKHSCGFPWNAGR